MKDFSGLSANVRQDGDTWTASITLFRPGKPDECVWFMQGLTCPVVALSELRMAVTNSLEFSRLVR